MNFAEFLEAYNITDLRSHITLNMLLKGEVITFAVTRVKTRFRKHEAAMNKEMKFVDTPLWFVIVKPNRARVRGKTMMIPRYIGIANGVLEQIDEVLREIREIRIERQDFSNRAHPELAKRALIGAL